jgi:hypothetical protein
MRDRDHLVLSGVFGRKKMEGGGGWGGCLKHKWLKKKF